MSAALCFCAVFVNTMRVLFFDDGRKTGINLNFFEFSECMGDDCHAQSQVIIPCADQAFALCRWRLCHMLFSILKKRSVYYYTIKHFASPFSSPFKKTVWECQICLSCYHMNAIISFISWWCISNTALPKQGFILTGFFFHFYFT